MKFDDLRLAERLHAYRDDFGNWRRWLADRPRYGHCGSIEWQYLPERLTEEEEKARREEKPPRIDTLAAMWMEEIVATMGGDSNPTPRTLIRLWWAKMLPADKVLRTLRGKQMMNFPAAEFEYELMRWSRFCMVKVQSRKRRRYNWLRAHGITPEPRWDVSPTWLKADDPAKVPE